MIVEWTRLAISDLVAIRRYIANHNPLAAEQTVILGDVGRVEQSDTHIGLVRKLADDRGSMRRKSLRSFRPTG